MISLKTAHPKLVYTCESAICTVVQGWGANTRNIFTLGMLIGILIAGVVGVLHMSTESGGWEGSSGILHPASCRSKGAGCSGPQPWGVYGSKVRDTTASWLQPLFQDLIASENVLFLYLITISHVYNLFLLPLILLLHLLWPSHKIDTQQRDPLL